MAQIFISYRRDDSIANAHLLYYQLKARFGDEVFWDIESIGAGVKFEPAINETINQIDAMIVVIGRQWLTIEDDNGVQRLTKPDDILRGEIATALERDIHIIPVLVGGAQMPSADVLPDNLKSLAGRNGVPLNYTQ